MTTRTLPTNSFKQALLDRKAQIGLWLGLADPYAAELCAGSGFDWLLIDGEHAPNDLRTTLSALQAIAAYPVQPVVRIPHGDKALIKQILEIGACNLLVPMVDSADQAHALVRAIRYPPLGERGVGSGLARSSRWTRLPNYLQEANELVCMLVQVETPEALTRIEEIAAVEGVDGLFIGPADLAATMGYLGQSEHPDVVGAIEAAIVRIVQAGKAPGILCANEALAHRYLALGAVFVAVGVDTSLLVRATASLAAAFKRPLLEAPAIPTLTGY